MAELLKIVRRGLHCTAVKTVSGGDSPGERGSFLWCELAQDHPGPLHYDGTDRVWWFADA